MTINEIDSRVRRIPDFPIKGVLFRDVTTLIKDPEGFKATIDEMVKSLEGIHVDLVCGPEARGFAVGSALAYALGAGFVLARKPGKLPCAVYKEEYALEYGTDSIEIHEDAIKPGQTVVIADDLLATGGTAKAVCNLIEKAGGKVVGLRFIIELCSEFDGRKPLEGYDVDAVLKY